MRNEFPELWAKLGKDDRRKLRARMEHEAIQGLSRTARFRLTSAQIKAAAKKKVDIFISQQKKAAHA